MKKVFVLFLLVLSINASAQLSVLLKNGVLISDVYIKESVFDDYESRTTYVPEITVGYSFGNISASLGLAYTDITFLAVENTVFFREYPYEPDPLITGTGFKATYKYSYSYVSIPLYASYQHKIDNFYIGADGGISFNIKTESDMKDSNSFIPSVLLGLKAGYLLTDKISLDITGRYNLSLSDMNEDNSILNGKLNSIVILAGINYKF